MRDMSKLRSNSFRANEAAANGREEAIHKYCRHFREASEQEAVSLYIDGLIAQYGPVVGGYPSWHPFTSVPREERARTFDPKSTPQGFKRLDHTIYLRDAFVTAPYGGVEDVIESARAKQSDYIDAEEISDVKLYHPDATPVLVTCVGVPKEVDETISKRFAVGNMLSTELPGWDLATCGESWEDMRRYILGTPCGSRSSLFVNQETGKALREVFELLNHHGLFGPLRP